MSVHQANCRSARGILADLAEDRAAASEPVGTPPRSSPAGRAPCPPPPRSPMRSPRSNAARAGHRVPPPASSPRSARRVALHSVAPWFHVLCGLAPTRAALLVDDRTTSRALLRELQHALRLEGPDNGVAPHVEALRPSIEAARQLPSDPASALTDAEQYMNRDPAAPPIHHRQLPNNRERIRGSAQLLGGARRPDCRGHRARQKFRRLKQPRDRAASWSRWQSDSWSERRPTWRGWRAWSRSPSMLAASRVSCWTILASRGSLRSLQWVRGAEPPAFLARSYGSPDAADVAAIRRLRGESTRPCERRGKWPVFCAGFLRPRPPATSSGSGRNSGSGTIAVLRTYCR